MRFLLLPQSFFRLVFRATGGVWGSELVVAGGYEASGLSTVVEKALSYLLFLLLLSDFLRCALESMTIAVVWV